jgi:predicted unusual protein kinase regulating ubiquinone biosynthesis (AarF/ABC1/UbiB family)
MGAGGGEKGDAERLPDDLERLGPTFVKLGQLLSSRPDLLPPPYIKALARLQDRVKPFPFQDVELTIQSELGAKINKVFSYFEPEPLAAASLGQVHRGALHDGRPVVVKVQRPNIARQIEEDFAALEEIAKFLERHTKIGQRYQLRNILDEFEKTLAHELDLLSRSRQHERPGKESCGIRAHQDSNTGSGLHHAQNSDDGVH